MLAFFEPVVKPFSYQSELERFIISKHPKDAADVERLIKQYNYETTRAWL